MLWEIEKSHLTFACQHRYSHLSLGGIRRTRYRKLVEGAVGQFCFIQDEHLEKRKKQQEAINYSLVNIVWNVTGLMYIFINLLSIYGENIILAVKTGKHFKQWWFPSSVVSFTGSWTAASEWTSWLILLNIIRISTYTVSPTASVWMWFQWWTQEINEVIHSWQH